LIARAPVRISFGGGGTDFETFYNQYGGIVVSATIDRYVYAMPTPGAIESYYWQDGRWHRQKDTTWLREAVGHLGMDGVRIASEVPPGTGLGSSGSLVVAMIKTARGDHAPAEIAELACHIEIDLMGMPIGKQDQYAAAFEGLNIIRFSKTGVTVTPIPVPEMLEQRLMLFFLGNSRKSDSILRRQQRALELDESCTIRTLRSIGYLGEKTAESLQADNLSGFGGLLDASWQCKRGLTQGITNPRIDNLYAAAKAAGASGGKLTGAGGGGFLLLYCPEEKQSAVTGTLHTMGARRMEVRLT